MLAAVPAASKGTLTDKDARWIVRDVQAGYGSPVSDGAAALPRGQRRRAVRLRPEGRPAALAQEPRHHPEVVAGAGRREALRRHGEREALHPQAAGGRRRRRSTKTCCRTDPTASRRRSSPRLPSRAAASTSRRWMRSTRSGRRARRPAGRRLLHRPRRRAPAPAAPAPALLVTPTELILKPGQSVALAARAVRRERERARRRRAAGHLDAREPERDDRERHVHGRSQVAGAQAGLVKAAVGPLSGAARIRVIPDLPWTFDFEDGSATPPAHWVNATGKFAVRDLDGSKVLVKLAENPSRSRSAAACSSADPTTATTRSRPTCARSSAAGSAETSASWRSATN